MARLRFWMSIILGIPVGIIAGYAFGNSWGNQGYLGCDVSCFTASLQGPAIGILMAPVIIFYGITIFWRPQLTCDSEETLDNNPDIAP